jgi:hypothetical protein
MRSGLVSRALASGLFCLAFGSYVVWQSQAYAFGTVRSMGPGFAPTVLGTVLAGIGVAMMVTALWDRERIGTVNLRPLVMIVLAIVAFALMIPRFGLVPAVLTTVVLAGFSDQRVRPLLLAAVAVGLLALVWAVFIWLLSMQIPLFRWRP